MSSSGGTLDRLERELIDAEAELRRILMAAPLATTKYSDIREVGRAVFRALTQALARISEAEVKRSRWKHDNPQRR